MATKKTAAKRMAAKKAPAKKAAARKIPKGKNAAVGKVAAKNAVGKARTPPSTNATPAQVPSENNQQATPHISAKRWQYYKQREFAPLWIAVALTMNLNPRGSEDKLKKTLKGEQKTRYFERKKIAYSQYGKADLLPLIDHHAMNEKPGAKVVALKNMFNFAKAMEWSIDGSLDTMRIGLGIEPQSHIEKIKQFDNVAEIEYGKGAEYRAVRMGALLDLINQWIKKGGEIPKVFIHGLTLSIDPLAEELEGQIKKKAQANGLEDKVPAQGKAGIRKQLGEDQKTFADVGRCKKKNRGK
jgi:hypothetical protein